MIDPNAPLVLDNVVAQVLEFHWVALEHIGAEDPGGVLVARVDGPEPYVTWEFVRRPSGQTTVSNGHYFTSSSDARADYRDRVRRGY